jgi:hypothetical protein
MLVPSSSAPVLGKTLVIGGLAASLIAITVASAALATHAPRATIDPCAVTFDMASLSQRDRALVARRSLACSDVEHGRITQAEYQQQVAVIDAAWTTAPAPTMIAAPAIQWAATVRGFSSQYTTTSWAADRVLGAPDVFPTHGDNANAWASLGADDKDEWLEVGYAQPTRISAIDVFETYNPGAISAVEMITASGEHITAYQGAPQANGAANKLHVDVGCTAEPIVAVHVRVASRQVAGWNEIDAIGVSPCAQ